MITPEAVVLYLEDNGVTVTGSTDEYFRLSDNKFKAWYVETVPQPTKPALVPYENTIREQKRIEHLREVAIRAEEAKKRAAEVQDFLDNGTTPEAAAYRNAINK